MTNLSPRPRTRVILRETARTRPALRRRRKATPAARGEGDCTAGMPAGRRDVRAWRPVRGRACGGELPREIAMGNCGGKAGSGPQKTRLGEKRAGAAAAV